MPDKRFKSATEYSTHRPTQLVRERLQRLTPEQLAQHRARSSEYQAIWQTCRRISHSGDYKRASVNIRRKMLLEATKRLMDKRRASGKTMCGTNAGNLVDGQLKKEAQARAQKRRGNGDEVPSYNQHVKRSLKGHEDNDDSPSAGQDQPSWRGLAAHAGSNAVSEPEKTGPEQASPQVPSTDGKLGLAHSRCSLAPQRGHGAFVAGSYPRTSRPASLEPAHGPVVDPAVAHGVLGQPPPADARDVELELGALRAELWDLREHLEFVSQEASYLRHLVEPWHGPPTYSYVDWAEPPGWGIPPDCHGEATA